MTPSGFHESVLEEETVAALALAKGDVAVDCTVGAGGHARRLGEAVGRDGLVIGLDQDEDALAIARERLADMPQCHLHHVPFSKLTEVLTQENTLGRVKGICADLGVSSMQFDRAERGFSYAKEGPLDMRMDRRHGRTAADLINDLSVDELARLFQRYGEEPQSRRIAKAIEKARTQGRLATTTELADIVKNAVSYKERSRRHPATRVFQALRIAVGGELDELESLLEQALDALKPGGRFAVISFHSLEDRLVKRQFKSLATGTRQKVPRDLPITEGELHERHGGVARIVKPFPIRPQEPEIAQNPRARSARLRVLEKTDPQSMREA